MLDVVLKPETGGSRPWLNCFASAARRSTSALSSDFSRSHTSWVMACSVRSLVRISENRSFNCIYDVNTSCVAWNRNTNIADKPLKDERWGGLDMLETIKEVCEM